MWYRIVPSDVCPYSPWLDACGPAHLSSHWHEIRKQAQIYKIISIEGDNHTQTNLMLSNISDTLLKCINWSNQCVCASESTMWPSSLSLSSGPSAHSPREDCCRVLRFCMGSLVTKILWFQPKTKFRNPLSPHTMLFLGVKEPDKNWTQSGSGAPLVCSSWRLLLARPACALCWRWMWRWSSKWGAQVQTPSWVCLGLVKSPVWLGAERRV